MRSLLRGGLLACVLQLVAAAPALATPPITEFNVPSGYKPPVAIADGPNGNIWFTQNDLGAVGEIMPVGAVSEISGLAHGGAGIEIGRAHV